MKKLKVAVYAICKNESKNIDKWYNSMKEADEIVVLDTGSTDNSFIILNGLPKIKVYQEIISPWRFDIARNISLSYVSEDIDICVCTDIDEIFEKGWCNKLKKTWKESTTRARYLYNWSHDEQNNPLVSYYADKIHSRNDYEWIYPVHEVLKLKDNKTSENEIIIDEIVLNHYPDNLKSRSSYLPLLELSVSENPNDDRNMHYLGREYMFYQKWDDAILTLHKHLNLPSAKWKDERAASMRYIANSYFNKNFIEEAIFWYKKAINEAPYLREAYFDLAQLYLDRKEYNNTIKYLEKALEIKEKSITYITNELAWNENIYDLISIAYYYIENYEKSFYYSKIAFSMNQKNSRIKENYYIIKEKYENEKEEIIS